jgi:transcriptional regulator
MLDPDLLRVTIPPHAFARMPHDPEPVDLLPGTLDMMVLKAVAAEPMHGFGMARWIEGVTGQRLTVEEGALYPALHRMEKRGWLTSEWGRTERGRRARFYTITEVGREELEAQVERWEGSAWAVRQVLEAGG